jgi:hypothetical protein
MRPRSESILDWFSTTLHRRPLLILAITGLVLVVLADDGRWVAPDVTYWGVMSWVAVVLMTCTAIATLAWSRLVSSLGHPPAGWFTTTRWALGTTPALAGFVAVLTGSPLALMWIGFGLSLALLGFVTALITRSSSN